jgi:hypothetical protein
LSQYQFANTAYTWAGINFSGGIIQSWYSAYTVAQLYGYYNSTECNTGWIPTSNWEYQVPDPSTAYNGVGYGCAAF